MTASWLFFLWVTTKSLSALTVSLLVCCCFLFNVSPAFYFLCMLRLSLRSTTVFVFALFFNLARLAVFCFSFACMFFVRVCEHVSIPPLCGSFLISLHFVFEAKCFFSFIRFPLFFLSACSFVFPSLSPTPRLAFINHGVMWSARIFLPHVSCQFPQNVSVHPFHIFVASFVDEEELLRRNRRMRIIVVWYISTEFMHTAFFPLLLSTLRECHFATLFLFFINKETEEKSVVRRCVKIGCGGVLVAAWSEC